MRISGRPWPDLNIQHVMDAQKQNEFPISAVVIAATTLRCLVQNGCHLSNANVAKQTYHCLSSEEAKNQSCTPKIDLKKTHFSESKDD